MEKNLTEQNSLRTSLSSKYFNYSVRLHWNCQCFCILYGCSYGALNFLWNFSHFVKFIYPLETTTVNSLVSTIISPYQFIEVVEPTNVLVIEEYLRHSIPTRSFLRFAPSLWVSVQIDIHVFYAEFLHFILRSHAKRTTSDRENYNSSLHVWWVTQDRSRRRFQRSPLDGIHANVRTQLVLLGWRRGRDAPVMRDWKTGKKLTQWHNWSIVLPWEERCSLSKGRKKCFTPSKLFWKADLSSS